MSKPGIAAVLSFLIPGLGQVYNRDFFRAFVWFLFALIISVTISPLSMGVPSLVYHLACAWAAYRRAETHPHARWTAPS
jgi:TM2 domain-containing membrane protein YozV